MADKLIVIMIRLLHPKRAFGVIWSWPLAVLLAPMLVGFIVAAHVALRFGLGAKKDPLGYSVVSSRA